MMASSYRSSPCPPSSVSRDSTSARLNLRSRRGPMRYAGRREASAQFRTVFGCMLSREATCAVVSSCSSSSGSGCFLFMDRLHSSRPHCSPIAFRPASLISHVVRKEKGPVSGWTGACPLLCRSGPARAASPLPMTRMVGYNAVSFGGSRCIYPHEKSPF